MAQVTPTGIQPRDLAGYRALFEQRFRDAFGPDLALEPETPQGEIIGIMALAATEADESLVALANGMSVLHASGRQLDDLGSLLFIPRKTASNTTAAATFAGVAGSNIPLGSIVRTTMGDEFVTTSPAFIPNAGAVDVSLSAINDGAITAEANTITQFVSILPGVETVSNAVAATPGRAIETDTEYRRRYRLLTSRLATSPKDALIAALTEAGIKRMRILENTTNRTVYNAHGQNLKPHSILCILHNVVQRSAVAAAILKTKGIGVSLNGVTEHNGAMWVSTYVRPITIRLNISITAAFPANGISEIKKNLIEFAERTFEIGKGIDERRMFTPINAVPGHKITAIQFELVSPRRSIPTPDVRTYYTLAENNITISVG